LARISISQLIPIRATSSCTPIASTAPLTVMSVRTAPNARLCATVSMTLGPGSRIITVVATTNAR
jgi:hypothetical protein